MTHTPDPQTQAQFYRDVPLKRLLAWVVDTLVTLLACVVILPFTAFTGLFFFPALYVTVNFIYRVVTLANRSATWGMRLFAVEIRQANGERLDATTALMHTIGYAVSWAVAPLQLISVVMMACTERKQGLSDHALGTVAINRRAAD
ncbi:RDD family protein [Sulfitobacter sp. D35]|uniref:RDD family protein n=1 Tax=Sulfitobacter sp. D35 TaxID=3083252 RepID=UPI0039908844